ncbi:MAG: glycosyltransferase [Candidatus Omnitrophota bacterium]|nr:glycosyltransferase [Candidatus Omnitrophota bacterium]
MLTFSVITPAYNAEAFIGRAIESVRNQTYPDWEMVIVNNGSTDNTKAEIEKFIIADSRIKLINCEKNSGSPARPRNLGLKEAIGEYIAFLDADDAFFPEKLAEAEKFFLHNPDAGLVCHGEAHVKNNSVIRRDYYGPYTTYRDLLFRGNSLSTSAVVMKRNCIEKVGFFSVGKEVSGFEDYDYWLRVARVCKIKYLRKILGVYTINNNTECSRVATNCKNALDFLEFHYSEWPNKSLHYRYLFRKRKAMCLRIAGRELIRMGDFNKAVSILGQSILYYPLDFKEWVFLVFAIIGKLFIKKDTQRLSTDLVSENRHEIIKKALSEILCCPICKNDLVLSNCDRLDCLYCHTKYSIKDGILVLMTVVSEEQINEQRLREEVAKGHMGIEAENILEVVSQHHCIPIMSRRANNFRLKFSKSQWILDVGCGSGYYWRDTLGGNLIVMDFAFSNLKSAKTLLREQKDVIFIQADASNLPIKTYSLSGIWSVQVTQHFPGTVMNSFLNEVKRVMQNNFLIEIYNLNPAGMHRILYKVLGKEFHIKGKWKDMILNRLNSSELAALWKDILSKAHLKIGYSELFFHPDLHCKPKGNCIAFIEDLLTWITWLVRFFARQIQITISSGF